MVSREGPESGFSTRLVNSLQSHLADSNTCLGRSIKTRGEYKDGMMQSRKVCIDAVLKEGWWQSDVIEVERLKKHSSSATGLIDSIDAFILPSCPGRRLAPLSHHSRVLQLITMLSSRVRDKINRGSV